jgi:hypothetical protein
MKTLETYADEPTIEVVVKLPQSLHALALEQQIALRDEASGYQDFPGYIVMAVHFVAEADQFFRVCNLPENGGNRIDRRLCEKGSL